MSGDPVEKGESERKKRDAERSELEPHSSLDRHVPREEDSSSARDSVDGGGVVADSLSSTSAPSEADRGGSEAEGSGEDSGSGSSLSASKADGGGSETEGSGEDSGSGSSLSASIVESTTEGSAEGPESGYPSVAALDTSNVDSLARRLTTIPPESKVSTSAAALEPSRRSTVASIRAVALVAQRMIALGLLTVIGSALLNSALAVRLFLPATRVGQGMLGDGLVAGMAGGLLSQVGLLIFLPVFSWAVAWVLLDRPYRLAIGAALFVEIWHVSILMVTSGAGAVVADPFYSASRLVFAIAAGLLGGLAYRHGRRTADREASS